MSDDKPTQELVRELLARVKYPGFPRDVVSLGIVADVQIAGRDVAIALRLPGGRTDVPPVLEREIAAALAERGLRARLSVAGAAAPAVAARPGPPTAEGAELPGVRAVIAVSSAKGGVGKSTVATNLACALSVLGLEVGLLDADVYGPSLPIMMGTDARPHAAGGNRFHPVERYGVRCISMGFFLDETSPVIWRGPMVAGLVRQFLNDCVWGELDVLVIDLPPGTGDAQLTITQQAPLSGGVIVTTPQDVALLDVQRGITMFQQVHAPVLGVVENMSFHVCSGCGDRAEIFGHGGGRRLAGELDIPFLGEIPLVRIIRESMDRGAPVVVAEPASPEAEAFLAVARGVLEQLAARGATQLPTVH